MLEDENIKTMNRELIWHPEVEYPMLNSLESENIGKMIESILIANKTQNNFMSKEKHKELLTDKEIKIILSNWNDFQIKLKDEYAKINYDYSIENPQYISNLSYINFVNYW